IGFRDRHVLAEPEDVVAVNPHIISVVGAALGVEPLELRAGQAIDVPAFRTLLTLCGGRAIERTLAQLAIEACDVAARQHGPDHTIEPDVDAARTERALRRL